MGIIIRRGYRKMKNKTLTGKYMKELLNNHYKNQRDEDASQSL